MVDDRQGMTVRRRYGDRYGTIRYGRSVVDDGTVRWSTVVYDVLKKGWADPKKGDDPAGKRKEGGGRGGTLVAAAAGAGRVPDPARGGRRGRPLVAGRAMLLKPALESAKKETTARAMIKKWIEWQCSRLIGKRRRARRPARMQC